MQTHPVDRASSDPVEMADSVHRVHLFQSCTKTPVCHGLQFRVVQWDSYRTRMCKKKNSVSYWIHLKSVCKEKHSPEQPRVCRRAKRIT